MKILYDGRVFQYQRAGGINRYFSEIISRLPADYHPVITGVEDFGEIVPKQDNLEVRHFNLFRPRRLSRKLRDKWWKPQVLKGIDLFHPMYYDLTSGLSFSDFKCPIVLTVYDFIYSAYPNLLEQSEMAIQDQTDAIQKADYVICISKATQNDLLERFPEKQGKTTVVHLGSSFVIQPELPDLATFENPYFLFIGSRGGYKNFSFLLRAFAKASEINPQIRLLVAGTPLNSEEKWQIYLLGITDRVESIVYPSEQTLTALYRSSVALLYPSLHEGFGIPPLEAMACRTIAVTSNTTSLPEVVGDAGIMLDPTDEDAWIDSMVKLSRPFRERSNLIELGLTRVKQFTWDACVQRHLEIYVSLS